MKKIFSLLFALSLITGAFAQGRFQATVTNTGNVLTFKLRPIGGNVTAGLSDIEFFLRYPNPSPAFTYGAVTANTTNFPGMTATGTPTSGSWEIERDLGIYTLPGYHTDHFIYTAPAPISTVTTYTNNVEYDLISVPLLGPTNTVDFQLIHQNTEATYYLAITGENGNDLRPAAFTSYFYPTTTSAAGPSSSTFYYAALNAVPIPVKFTGFTATKRDDNAVLNWSVENESSITDRYEIERSLNAVDFTKIATVLPKYSGSTNVYDLTDLHLSAVRASGVIYYRIKQVDKDGKFVYTEIRSVRLDKGIAISVYPNPIKDVATVTLDLTEAADVSITVNDAAGKQVQKILLSGNKGINIKKVDLGSMAAGTYLFKVTAGAEVKTVSVVKAQ